MAMYGAQYDAAKNQFCNCLVAALQVADESCGVPSHFDERKLFEKWFSDTGTSFYFLFKKNLKVTNIQYAELLALIRGNTAELNSNLPVADLVFLPTRHFRSAIRTIISQFPNFCTNPVAAAKQITDLYYHIFHHVVLIDSFHGSAVVFLPQHLSLDVKTVCATSGYIHSCGPKIFARRVDKATKVEFLNAIQHYLDKRRPERKIFFTVYAHEDFKNEPNKPVLRDGLDDVKLYIEKYFMDDVPLSTIIQQVAAQFEKQLHVSPAGQYDEVRKRIAERSVTQPGEVDFSTSIFLLVDHDIDTQSYKRGDIKYYLCYEQLYKNEDPFQIFDENKPGWVAHTTLPHSLMAAMVNVTRPWPLDHNIRICDPFAGTGTAWLEGMKLKGAEIRCCDIAPIAEILLRDNVEFFCLDEETLCDIHDRLTRICEFVVPSTVDTSVKRLNLTSHDKSSYEWATALCKEVQERMKKGMGPSDAVEELISDISTHDLFSRILFYLGMRTLVRYSGAWPRQSIDWGSAYRFQADELASQVKQLAEWRRAIDKGTERHDNVVLFSGKYSRSCSIDPRSVRDKDPSGFLGIPSMAIQKAQDLPEGSADIIVTDPPYGFNTNDDIPTLAALYSDVIKSMVKALNPVEGQLIICVPEWSHTGRRIPFCARKELIIRQIIAAAEEQNKEVVAAARPVPHPSALYRPPYYWESVRALRRSILHFRIRAHRP